MNNFKQQTEALIREQLNVKNPILLKTGVGGFVVNLLNHIKNDAEFYTQKMANEISPVTAKKINSIYSFADRKNLKVGFSKPSEHLMSIVIPDLTLSDGEIVTYTLTPEVSLIDKDNDTFTLEDTIKIYVSKNVIAKSYNSEIIEDLEIYKSNTNTGLVYLIQKPVKQYKRNFYQFQIPNGNYQMNFDINIQDIYEINVWELNNSETIDLNKLKNYKSKDLTTVLDLNNIEVKWNRRLSSPTDNHVFISSDDIGISLTVGDGIQGKIPSNIIVEIKETKGLKGNKNASDIDVNNVQIQKTSSNGDIDTDITSVKMLSLNGGGGGSTLSVDEIRRKILQTRNQSLCTKADLRNYYWNDTRPFITSRYFNTKGNMFIYRALKDRSSNTIIKSSTFNLKEDELFDNPFMPEKEVDGLTIISPFYFKKKQSIFESYIVIPEIKIPIQPEISTSQDTKLQNQIGIYLTYNWFERKTYIEARNVNPEYTYIINTNIQQFKLDITNSYKIELNKTYLNKYCFLDGEERELFDPDGTQKIEGKFKLITINVQENENHIMTFKGTNQSFTQIKFKQQHPYWVDVDLFDTRLVDKFILNIPFIEKEYIKKTNLIKFNQLLDEFFDLDVLQDAERLLPTMDYSQTLFNTISVNPKYRNYIFNQYNLIEPQINLNIELVVNSNELNKTKFDTQKLKTEIEWVLRPKLDEISGSDIEFYESQLEQLVTEHINKEYSVIQNIRIYPNGPIEARTDKEIEQLMDDNYTSNDNLYTPEKIQELNRDGELPLLTQKERVDFVPNFFYFGELNLNIEFR